MLSTHVSALIKIIKFKPFPPLCTTYDNAELSDEIRNFEKNSLSNNNNKQPQRSMNMGLGKDPGSWNTMGSCAQISTKQVACPSHQSGPHQEFSITKICYVLPI